MTGIENITGRILSDAQAEIDAINSGAAAEESRIREEYAARARRESEEILAKGARAAEERGSRLISAAHMESGKMQLAARQELLDKAFALALEKLCTLPEQEQIALLASLIFKACDTGTEEAVFNPEDRARYGEAACAAANESLRAAGREGGITLSGRTAEIRGGLVLSSGAIEVNCSYETLVRQVRGEAIGEVSRVLFG